MKSVGNRPASAQMSLAAFMCGDSNYHMAGWRHADAIADAGSNFAAWIGFAKMLEDAKFDMMFLADTFGIPGLDDPLTLRHSSTIERFEPLTLLSALAPMTSRLGLVATAATTYAQPFDTARQFASLDRISDGRVGWNIVTGGMGKEAENFSLASHVPSSERYQRCGEYVDVVTSLWGSVDEAAFIRDKQSGIYCDPAKLRKIDHKGKYFSVAGPLSVAHSRRGRPVLVQAGQSEDGRQLASRVADVVFTAQTSFEVARDFYSDIKGRAETFGRDPASIKVMPGVSVTVAATREGAIEKAAQLDELINIDAAIARLQLHLPGIDLGSYDLDEPFPELEGNSARVSAPPAFTAIARRDGLSLRQVALRAAVSKAHLSLAGTPEEIADILEHWFRGGAADGFNLLPLTVPSTLNDFIEMVLPELRRRGLFRTDYEGTTLRDHLGLA